MDKRLIIGALVHVLMLDHFGRQRCYAAFVVHIQEREVLGLYCLPHLIGYKDREEEGEILRACPYNPSIDVVGGWHWPDPVHPLCGGYR